MGPPPTEAPRPSTASPVTFEEVPAISTKTYCGGRTKDHILESGGNGVALLDFDGDGRLDIYLVTAFELSDAREKIRAPQRTVQKRGRLDISRRLGGLGAGRLSLGQRCLRGRL